jgi:hypothetical protein
VVFLVNQYYFRMKRLQTGDEQQHQQQLQQQGRNQTTLVDHHRHDGEMMPPNKIQKKSTNKDGVPYEPLVSECGIMT